MKKHIKCNENVVVNGLAMDIYEMKKKYEVRFLFKKREHTKYLLATNELYFVISIVLI